MADDFAKDNAGCGSDEHGRHLCYHVSQGFHLSDPAEYLAMIKEPRFVCRHCGRTANDERSICKPTKLKAN